MEGGKTTKTSTQKPTIPDDKPKDDATQPNGSPFVPIFFSLFFTLYTYVIVLVCHTGKWNLLQLPATLNNSHQFLEGTSALMMIGWFMIQCALYLLPIGGPVSQGAELKCGRRLDYRLNALFVLVLNMSMFFVAHLADLGITQLSETLPVMLTSGVIISLFASVVFYIKGSFVKQWKLNPAGNSGSLINDWFFGRELNPRIGKLDIKYVLFRSGIIGWILFNIVNLLKSREISGYYSATMIGLFLMQLLYVADYFWLESGVLVSRDIVHEGLGYNIMIQFLMIPFCFSVQTRYLMTTKYELPWYCLVSVGLLNLIGYYIYRASNSEKNNFRKNPNDPALAHLKTMPTSSGKRLLISGWWGMCRHPNYLGDLLISLSYALTTGFNHLVPYLGTIFLVLLLLDRERKDSAECRKKYGPDWDKYCNIVKYRIIPGIY